MSPRPTFEHDDFGKRIGPLLSAIFALHLMISTNYLPEVCSPVLPIFLSSHHGANHVVGFFSMFLVVNLVSTNTMNWDMWIVFGMTFVLYTLFVMSNTLGPRAQGLALLLLAAVYCVNLHFEVRQTAAGSIEESNETTQTVTHVQWGLAAAATTVILLGFLRQCVTRARTHRLSSPWSVFKPYEPLPLLQPVT